MCVIHGIIYISPMITLAQIKAARALLDWTQQNLAEASGVHINAVNNLERGTSHKPRAETLARIQSALETRGVRFLGNYGVELADQKLDIRVFEGDTFISDMNRDLFAQIRKGDEVLSLIPHESIYATASKKDVEEYYAFMKRTGFKERLIVSTPHPTTWGDKKSYRWLPPDILGTMSYFVYANTYALIRPASRQTVLIRSRDMADSFRQQFEFFWRQAKPLK